MAKKKAMGLEPLPPVHQISDDFSSEDEESHLRWKDEEDELLKELVKRHGSKKWEVVATRLPGKSAKECKDRWHAQLHASMNKSSWTEEEDKKLLDARKECGNKWTEIAQRVPGRTDNAVKNRYQALKRRQIEELALSEKAPQPTSLMGPPEPQLPKPKRKYTKRATLNKEPLTVIAEEDILLGPSTSGNGSDHLDKKQCIRPDLSIQIPYTGSNTPALPIPLAVGPPVVPEPQLLYPLSGRMTPSFMSSEAIQHLLNSSLNDTPRESIDMDEVMGWLTAQTPTPSTCNPGTASTTANNSLASSSFTSASTTPARMTPSPGFAGFKFFNLAAPSPRQLMSSKQAAANDRSRGFGFGHSPANLMGPSLNVSELEDLVRLLSGSEGADLPSSMYADSARRSEGPESFLPMTTTNQRVPTLVGMDGARGPAFDHLSLTGLFNRSSFEDKIR